MNPVVLEENWKMRNSVDFFATQEDCRALYGRPTIPQRIQHDADHKASLYCAFDMLAAAILQQADPLDIIAELVYVINYADIYRPFVKFILVTPFLYPNVLHAASMLFRTSICSRTHFFAVPPEAALNSTDCS